MTAPATNDIPAAVQEAGKIFEFYSELIKQMQAQAQAQQRYAHDLSKISFGHSHANEMGNFADLASARHLLAAAAAADSSQENNPAKGSHFLPLCPQSSFFTLPFFHPFSSNPPAYSYRNACRYTLVNRDEDSTCARVRNKGMVEQ